MQLSSSLLVSALWSCCLHSVALGLAATLMVAQPQQSFRVVQVTLMQQATPLPLSQGEPARKPSAPEERPASVSQAPPQPKPKPVVKPVKAETKPKQKMPASTASDHSAGRRCRLESTRAEQVRMAPSSAMLIPARPAPQFCQKNWCRLCRQ